MPKVPGKCDNDKCNNDIPTHGRGRPARWCSDLCRKAHEWVTYRENQTPEEFRRKNRVRNLRWKYGITVEQFDDMVTAQDGRCAICRDLLELDAVELRLVVIDHCHKTDVVRGVTCSRCNTLLGMSGDDPKLLRAAADYLDANRVVTV